MVILEKIQGFFNYVQGDPTSPTFQTRKTLFELLLGIFGFIAVKKISDKYL